MRHFKQHKGLNSASVHLRTSFEWDFSGKCPKYRKLGTNWAINEVLKSWML